MRLTLRTLLAYLDDILEPGQAREIGEKISESGYASALVDRIREVMRRRRLTAPDVKGPGSGPDANSISEYLDNTLSPEAVADVEKVCLDSDVHLAEVAACHQILTLVLGEPVDVPAATRERMYALGPAPKPAGTNGRQPAGAEELVATPSAAAGTATPVGDFEPTIPDYLKPAPLWRRMAPVAVGVLVGSLWLAIVYFDPTLSVDIFTSGTTDTTVAQVDVDGVGDETAVGGAGELTALPETDVDIDSTIPAGQTEPKVSTEVGTAAPDAAARDISELNGFDPAPPSLPGETPATPMPATVAAATTTPASRPGTPIPSATEAGTTRQPAAPSLPDSVTPPTGTAVADASTATKPTAVPETIIPPKVPAPEVLYTSREGVLVRQSDEGWLVMPRRTTIRTGDRLASPEPFSALLEVDSLNLMIELHGGTVIEFLGATDDEAIVLRMLSGRVSLQRQSPDETGESTTSRSAGVEKSNPV